MNADILELVFKSITSSNVRAIASCVCREWRASGKHVGFNGAVRTGRYAFSSSVTRIVTSRSGRSFIVVTRDNVHVVNAQNGAITCSSPPSMWGACAFSPDETSIVAISDGNCDIAVYSASTFEVQHRLRCPKNAYTVAWNEQRLCAMFWDSPMVMWKEVDGPAIEHDFSEIAVGLSLTDTHVIVGTTSYVLQCVPFDKTERTTVIELPTHSLLCKLFTFPHDDAAIGRRRWSMVAVSQSGDITHVDANGCVDYHAVVGKERCVVEHCCADDVGNVYIATNQGMFRARHTAAGVWSVVQLSPDTTTTVIEHLRGHVVTSNTDAKAHVTVALRTEPM